MDLLCLGAVHEYQFRCHLLYPAFAQSRSLMARFQRLGSGDRGSKLFQFIVGCCFRLCVFGKKGSFGALVKARKVHSSTESAVVRYFGQCALSWDIGTTPSSVMEFLWRRDLFCLC
jgi:hypothetical protein